MQNYRTMKNEFHTISITNLLYEKFVMQGNFVMSSIKIHPLATQGVKTNVGWLWKLATSLH